MKRNLFCLAAILFCTFCLCLSAKAQATAADDDKVYSQSEVDTRAVIARGQQAKTDGKCRPGTSGTIWFHLILRKTGNAEIVGSPASSGCEAFDQNAYYVVRNLKFTPAVKDGQPASVKTQMQFNYSSH